MHLLHLPLRADLKKSRQDEFQKKVVYFFSIISPESFDFVIL